jgi:hypothetical protein
MPDSGVVKYAARASFGSALWRKLSHCRLDSGKIEGTSPVMFPPWFPRRRLEEVLRQSVRLQVSNARNGNGVVAMGDRASRPQWQMARMDVHLWRAPDRCCAG